MQENYEGQDGINEVPMPEKEKKLIRETSATKALVERLAKLEGMTPTQMRAKMAQFYEVAVTHLFDGKATPDVLNAFVLDYRLSIMEKGMEAFGAELRGESQAVQAPPAQRLGERPFRVPGDDIIISRAEDDYSPQPTAPPTPAQRKVIK